VSYEEFRKAQREFDQNHDGLDHSWAEKECPLLHSGFISPCPADESKSSLFVSVWFTSGHYQVKILDRSSDEKAFARIENLETLFVELEKALREDLLDWTPDVRSREGSKFR